MSVRYNQRYQRVPEGYGQRFVDLGNEFFGLVGSFDVQTYKWATGEIGGHFSSPGGASPYYYAVQQVPLGNNELVTSTWLTQMESVGATDFVLWKVSSTGALTKTRYDVVAAGASFVSYSPTFRQIMAICSMGGRNFAALFRAADEATKLHVMRFSLSVSGALTITSHKSISVSTALTDVLNGGPNCLLWDAKLKRWVWFVQTQAGNYEEARLMVFNESGVISDETIDMGTVTGESPTFKYPFWSSPYLVGRELRFWLMDPSQGGAQRCTLNIDHLYVQKGEASGYYYDTWWSMWNQGVFMDPTRGQREIPAIQSGDGEYIVDPETIDSPGGNRYRLQMEATEWDLGNDFGGYVKFGPGAPSWPSRLIISRDGRYAVYADGTGKPTEPLIVFNRVTAQPKLGRGTKRAHFS